MPRELPPHVFEPMEETLLREGFGRVAGLDEVGRGCLAGPVCAAAVVLPPGRALVGLDDSKRLTAAVRERLAAEILSFAEVGIGSASVEEIAELNILRASLLAMQRAVTSLLAAPDFLLVDGNQLVPSPLPQRTVVKGDHRCAAIAAASVVAKVHRDALMVGLDAAHPGYGFADHKGYGTEPHRLAIARLGPTVHHRRTFAGVAEHWRDPSPAPRATQLGLFGPRRERGDGP